MSRPLHRFSLAPVALLLVAALVGCTTLEPSRPTGHVPTSPNEWRMSARDQSRYDVVHSSRGKFLSVLYSRQMPYPLGNTFVNDLAIVIQDPKAQTYELPHDNVVVTLARATEVATRENALIHAVDGTLEIQEVLEGGFRGIVQAKFRDEATGASPEYFVLARFAPPGR